MSLECQGADADHARGAVAGTSTACCPYAGLVDPLVGWDLVQRDWGIRQREATVRSCPLARILASPIAVVQAFVRSLARCGSA